MNRLKTVNVLLNSSLSFKFFICAFILHILAGALGIYLGFLVKLVFTQVALIFYFFSGVSAIFIDQKFRLLSLLGKSVVTFYLFFFFNGFVQNLFSDGYHDHFLGFLLWDLGFYFIGFACLSLIGVSKQELLAFLYIYFASCILVIVMTLPYMNAVEVLKSEHRRAAFVQIRKGFESSNLIYVYQRSTSIFSILFLAFSLEFIKKRSAIILSMFSVLFLLFITLYYQKRDGFVLIGFFFLVFLIGPTFKYSIKRTSRKFVLFFALILAGAVGYQQPIFSNSIDRVVSRFLDTTSSTAEYDRFKETKYFLGKFPPQYYVLGRGHSSYFSGSWNMKGNNNLHLGAGNFILKGGYAMLISISFLLFISMMKGLYNLLFRNLRFQFWISAYTLIGIFVFSAYWGWYPNIMYLPIALFSNDIVRNFSIVK